MQSSGKYPVLKTVAFGLFACFGLWASYNPWQEAKAFQRVDQLFFIMDEYRPGAHDPEELAEFIFPAYRNDWSLLMTLIKLDGVDMDHQFYGDLTAMHYAVIDHDYQMALFLLDHGAAVDSINRQGDTPLLRAVIRSDPEMVQFLIDHGAGDELSEKEGKSLLWSAVNYQESAVLKQILDLDFKRDLERKDSFGRTLLQMADSNPEIFKLLIEHGARVDTLDKEGSSLLHQSVSRVTGSDQVMKLILDSGFDLNVRDRQGRTALHKAASMGHDEALLILLSYGADALVKDKEGKPPADLAYFLDHEATEALRNAMKNRAHTPPSSKE